jgi:hypothetical protein
MACWVWRCIFLYTSKASRDFKPRVESRPALDQEWIVNLTIVRSQMVIG